MGVIVNDFQERFYLILTGIFIASLVACNLIFQKFFTWNFLGINFELSVGIIAYPVTFLVTYFIFGSVLLKENIYGLEIMHLPCFRN